MRLARPNAGLPTGNASASNSIDNCSPIHSKYPARQRYALTVDGIYSDDSSDQACSISRQHSHSRTSSSDSQGASLVVSSVSQNFPRSVCPAPNMDLSDLDRIMPPQVNMTTLSRSSFTDREASSSSPPPPHMPQAKLKKFDIKISHFSNMAGKADEECSGQESGPRRSGGAEGSEREDHGGLGPVRTKKQRGGRERTRINLAPDQPPTTQGKQRERVYVACLQCRSRKIRCDGAKPMCYNCLHRSTGICEYDAVPKRRGPDRQPGARQRPGKVGQKGDGRSSEHDESSPSATQRSPVTSVNAPAPRRRSTIANASVNTAPTLALPIPLPFSTDPGLSSGTSTSDTDPQSGTWANVSPLSATLQNHHPHQFQSLPSHDSHIQSYPYTVSQERYDRGREKHNNPHVHGYSQGLDSGALSVPPKMTVPRITTTQNSYATIMTPPPMSSDLFTPSEYVSGHGRSMSFSVDANAGVTHSDSTYHPGHHNHLAHGHPTQVHSHLHPSHHAPTALLSDSFGEFSLPPLPGNVATLLPADASGVHIDAIGGVSRLSSSASPDSAGFVELVSPVGSFPPLGQALAGGRHLIGQQQRRQHLNLNVFSDLHQHHDEAAFLNLSSELQSLDGPTGYGTESATQLGLDPLSYNPYQWAVSEQEGASQDQALHAYITSVDEDETDQQRRRYAHSQAAEITHPPSLDFIRKTWWDSLLDTYTAEPYCTPAIAAFNQALYGLAMPVTARPGSVACPSSALRVRAAQLVYRDLQFLFKNSNYWFAFINVPLFFATLYETRETMQPALVLAVLAMSNFLRSSEAELGAEGRARTLWLRDKAQAALDASVNASWIDPGLAQAAWLLTLFEISSHPLRGQLRTESAFTTLDNIIRTLSLTYIDAEDPSTSTFHSQGYRQQAHAYPLPLYNRQPMAGTHPQSQHASQLLQYHPVTSAHGVTPALPLNGGRQKCSCAELSLGRNWPGAKDHTPLWLCTPAWNPGWSVADIRREECRRLCWNALTIAAGYTTYRSAIGMAIHDLFVLQPSNFQLLFPGENLSGLPSTTPDDGTCIRPTKESIWALYARSMLLWHACVRIRNENVSDHERARFASAVWLEADAIENALDGHTCQTERAFLFQGREYLFNARMYVSYEFRRFVPSPSPELSGSVHRRKAEEWLTHQATVSKRIMNGLQTVTGLKNNVLAKRPFFIFWFMGQISRCLKLWSLDKSLTVAIQLSKEFLPPIDYLTALWPCDDQRRQYAQIRRQLDQACLEIGLDLPPPPNYTLPPPSSPSVLP